MTRCTSCDVLLKIFPEFGLKQAYWQYVGLFTCCAFADM
jgi:hypothetical protein